MNIIVEQSMSQKCCSWLTIARKNKGMHNNYIHPRDQLDQALAGSGPGKSLRFSSLPKIREHLQISDKLIPKQAQDKRCPEPDFGLKE